MNDKQKIDELKHEVLEEKIESMNTKIHEGFLSINSTIEKGFKLINLESKRQAGISDLKRDEILKEQKLTNGRVKELEKVTSVIKFMRDHIKMSGLIFYAVYNILQVATPENIIKVYQWIKLMI